MLKRIDTTLREMYGPMAKLEANVPVDPMKLEQVREAFFELHRCRDRLHELREHPDYEYTTSMDNRDRGDGWQRNTHVGTNGIAGGRWHWMRRKGE